MPFGWIACIHFFIYDIILFSYSNICTNIFRFLFPNCVWQSFHHHYRKVMGFTILALILLTFRWEISGVTLEPSQW